MLLIHRLHPGWVALLPPHPLPVALGAAGMGFGLLRPSLDLDFPEFLWIWASQNLSGFGLPRVSLDLDFPELSGAGIQTHFGFFGFAVHFGSGMGREWDAEMGTRTRHHGMGICGVGNGSLSPLHGPVRFSRCLHPDSMSLSLFPRWDVEPADPPPSLPWPQPTSQIFQRLLDGRRPSYHGTESPPSPARPSRSSPSRNRLISSPLQSQGLWDECAPQGARLDLEWDRGIPCFHSGGARGCCQ